MLCARLMVRVYLEGNPAPLTACLMLALSDPTVYGVDVMTIKFPVSSFVTLFSLALS